MIKRKKVFFSVCLCLQFLVWEQTSASPAETRCYFQKSSICLCPNKDKPGRLGHSQGHIPYQWRHSIFFRYSRFLSYNTRHKSLVRGEEGSTASSVYTKTKIPPKSVPVLYYILE